MRHRRQDSVRSPSCQRPARGRNRSRRKPRDRAPPDRLNECSGRLAAHLASPALALQVQGVPMLARARKTMAAVLRADHVSKSFGPIEVLSDVSLDMQAGEVHAVIGENGAGKSTLMRILSGHLPPTKGGLVLDEEPVTFSGPVEAEHRGIVLVHQEILLAEDLTVAQNLFLGREVRRGGFMDDRAMRARTVAALDELGAHL